MSKKHHLPNGAFRNNAQLNEHSDLFKAIKWQWEAPKVERIQFPLVDNDPSYLKQNRTETTLTWVGHSTFLLQHNGINILTDPHLTQRASPFGFVGPKRYTQPGLGFDDLPEIDVVVVSHDHYDHLDYETVITLAKQQKNSPLFVVPLKIGAWLTGKGITHWVEKDWWETADVLGWKMTAVPVQHFSGRSLLRKNDTLWAGWVLETPEVSGNESKKILFIGDSGYSDDFKDIGERFGEIDLALVPIGAYEPRWFMKDVHANPEDAVKMHIDTKSKKSIAMHWGTFVLTDEPMDEPPKKLKEALTKYQVPESEFIVMGHGETTNKVF